MEKIGYIYKTTNLINNKIYIGKKVGNFNSKYFGSGIALANAIKKYGNNNFKAEVLKWATNNEELNKLEKLYIAKYRKKFGRRFLYNIAAGGDGGCLVRMFGKDNPMYNNHTIYVQREKRKCLSCNKKFKVRITSKKHYCSGSCSRKDKFFIYNKKLNKSKIISKEQQEDYLGNGWELGRDDSFREKCSKGSKGKNKGKVHIYNGELNKNTKIRKEELQPYLNDGWELGRGEKFAKKCSKSKKGPKNPMFGKGYLKIGKRNWMTGRFGSKCPFYGRKHTEESNQKNRDAHLGNRAWNKGLTKETDQTVLKYAQSLSKTLKLNGYKK